MSSFVLIPGAGGMAWYWHLVVPMLEEVGHEVTAVDIAQDDPALGLPEYAESVEEAVTGREDVVLVAQSMGAFTAAVVASRAPVRMLVLVNAMIPLPGETPGQWWAATGQPEAMRAADLREGRDDGFDETTHFLHDVPAQVIAAGDSAQRAPAETPFGQPCEFTHWPQMPMRVLVGSDDRFFPPDFQRRIAQQRVGVEPDEIPGGHLVALSNPQGLVEALVGYAAALH